MVSAENAPVMRYKSMKVRVKSYRFWNKTGERFDHLHAGGCSFDFDSWVPIPEFRFHCFDFDSVVSIPWFRFRFRFVTCFRFRFLSFDSDSANELSGNWHSISIPILRDFRCFVFDFDSDSARFQLFCFRFRFRFCEIRVLREVWSTPIQCCELSEFVFVH